MPSGTTPTCEAQMYILTCVKDCSGAKRPKWRLCFRLDQRMTSGKESVDEVRWKHQHDFFVTVVDPPVHVSGSFAKAPPNPFFASRNACHTADILVSRPMIASLPGQGFEGKAVAMIGTECVTAGLVAAMLGAKVIFIIERCLLPHVQMNLRLFRKDTLDYTKIKSNALAAIGCNSRRTISLHQTHLTEMIHAPVLDLVVLHETCLAETLGCSGSFASSCRRGSPDPDFYREPNDRNFWDAMAELVPEFSATRILLVCDKSFEETASSNRFPNEDYAANWQPWMQGLPQGLVLPPEWQARPFCLLPQSVPVIWLERSLVDRSARSPKLTPLRQRSVAPMGSTPLRSLGIGEAPPEEWTRNNARLKKALSLHNKWKQSEAELVLQEAKSYSKPDSNAFSSMQCSQNSFGFPKAPLAPSSHTEGPTLQDVLNEVDDELDAIIPVTTSNSNPLPPTSSEQFQSTADNIYNSSARPVPPPCKKISNCKLPSPNSARGFRSNRSGGSSRGGSSHRGGSSTCRDILPKANASHTSSFMSERSEADRYLRGPASVADRHADPPHWYRCNRPTYGSNRPSCNTSVTSVAEP
eukprot:TRINITY_DN64104_c0_g1_i1.p1 TRINITY_DN64104_c0_g1~~TRINITY_DN64104_c0_g1_i1.p1  ORF type:complete len:583 (-),score=64.06 TRINITY_DN64104_c0_g1_i1:64-1812(-)